LYRNWTRLGLLCAIALAFGCHGQATPPVAVNTEIVGTPNHGKFAQVYAVAENGSSFIYVKPAGSSSAQRLSTRKQSWEMDPVLSPSGKMIAYSVSDNPDAKSEVWVSQIDGNNAHRVSAPEQDALMPAFCPDSRTLLYVISRFNGHYSPIARPRKHDFDVMKIMVDATGPVAGATPVELTQQHFFDMRSLSVSSDGQHFLISTSGYPIGDLIEGFDINNPAQIKFIYQPHVPSEPQTGAAFGGAAYIHDGMDIVFTAASEPLAGGNFDYNVYQMSAVTGGEIKLLAQHSGVIDTLDVGPGNSIFVTAGGTRYTLNTQTKALNPI